MKQAKDYLIFPLDVPSVRQARPCVERLSGQIGMFKVGLELFVAAGPEVIRLIRSSGPAEIFLDLKLHDIPATVERTMRVIADYGVRFATVHCGESMAMLKAAVAGSRGQTGVLGVTVLTSVGPADIENAGFEQSYADHIETLVMKRAAMARDAGCAGIVCSGHEAGPVKQAFQQALTTVTPGIRPSWESAANDDQKRVMTPARAIANGSDYLVIGRPIRDAEDPLDAVRKITAEIRKALTSDLKIE